MTDDHQTSDQNTDKITNWFEQDQFVVTLIRLGMAAIIEGSEKYAGEGLLYISEGMPEIDGKKIAELVREHNR